MPLRRTLLALPLALAAAMPLALAAAAPASAQLLPIMLMDAWAKKENKVAAATPGHAEWCAKNHRGYRPQWNNYNDAKGIMRYCASPYYTPPWQVPFAKR